MSSRWATSPDEDAKAVAERKRRKEEKRRQREKKQHEASVNNASIDLNADRPVKRQRTTSPPQDEIGQVHLLEFPALALAQSQTLDQYEILNSIEEGSYGYVSRARNKISGDVVALKRLKLEPNNHDGFPVTGLREIQTLKACSHLHIVNLREVIVGGSGSGLKQDVYLVMDFLEHDLKTLLEDMTEPFLPSETKTLLRQLCSATEYLHSNWIMHRDLKTSNILLNNRGEIKLADFGMARYTSSPPPRLTQLVVTLWYRAPELLLGAEEYHFEIDIWSIGCIFAELLTREPLFQGRNEVAQLSSIFTLLGTPTRDSWPNFKSLPNAKALYPLLNTPKSQTQHNKTSLLTATKFPYLTTAGLRLLTSMLSLNPATRPTASEILVHPYFREDPRPKPKEMFPTFPSKAGQEKRRRRASTPHAPARGERAPELGVEEFAEVFRGGSGGGAAL